MSPDTVLDVSLDSFETEVLARSHDVPVVVDFWAAWCGPCRTLGPMIEDAVQARGGDVVLAKVDVDANPPLAQRYRVQGIPAVKAFVNGEVVDEFTGAQPRQAIEAFLDRVVPSATDRLVAEAQTLAATDPEAATAKLREALEAEPRHRDAALALADLTVAEDPATALELVNPHRPDPRAEEIVARAEMQAGGGDVEALRARVEADADDGEAQLTLGRALAASGEHEAAADAFLAAIRLGGDTREPAREQLLNLFTILGDEHAVTRSRRPKLAAALF